MRALPLLIALAACRADDAPSIARPFPEGFLWGSATAGFQVEMGCPTWSDERCLDTHSDWYQWVTSPEIVGDEGLYVTGQDVRDGPGMWETFEDDVARMKADGHGAFRMSLEWSRLFPDDASDVTTVEGLAAKADPDAVARYREMITALRDAGLQPLVNVNHYTLPLWVHDGVACHADLATCPARGWVDGEEIVPRIALFAGYAGATFGDLVDRWGTLNEPFATTLSGYLQPGADRSAPPGRGFDGPSTVATIRNQIVGSAAMYDALHANDAVDADGDGATALVGLVLNMGHIVPRDAGNPADVAAVAHADHLYHRLFLDGLTSGAWDDDLDGTFESNRPDLVGRLDWLGVNYYNRIEVASIAPVHPLPDVPAFDFLPNILWSSDPEGLAAVMTQADGYGLPLIVTENGNADPDPDLQSAYLDDHVAALWTAIDGGADVRGYLWWSYVDNYEWNHGLDMRFGLYALDEGTKARTQRPVGARLTVIAGQNGLE